jgi:hypothetical protein
MKQAIILNKAYVEARPKACPNLAKVVKSVEYLLETDPIAVSRQSRLATNRARHRGVERPPNAMGYPRQRDVLCW